MCDRLLSPLPEAVKLDRGDSGPGTRIYQNLLTFKIMCMRKVTLTYGHVCGSDWEAGEVGAVAGGRQPDVFCLVSRLGMQLRSFSLNLDLSHRSGDQQIS